MGGRFLFIPVLLGLAFTACGPPPPAQETPIIRLKGSDTMVQLARRWAAAYMTRTPNVSVYAEGGGSSTGIRALLEGTTDIAMTSRLIIPGEASRLARRFKSLGISYLVAKDAISFYVHPSNPARNFSLDQIRDIFSGRITDWATLGGDSARITLVLRPPTSGTYWYIKNHILKPFDYGGDMIYLPTTQEIVNYIETHPHAIGFGGIGYGRQIYHARVNGISPTEETIRNDQYPVARYLYLYTVDTPSRPISRFIDWVVSPAGQRIVREAGYTPLWP